jgi:hypothetical protein
MLHTHFISGFPRSKVLSKDESLNRADSRSNNSGDPLRIRVRYIGNSVKDGGKARDSAGVIGSQSLWSDIWKDDIKEI